MRDVKIQAGGLCACFGHSVVPTGACSSARQTSMSDSPPQAIHGLLSAYKLAMDGARPRQDMDVLPREKRPPADRTRRPTRARTAGLAEHSHTSEEHTSEPQSLLRTTTAVFCFQTTKL